MSGVQPSPLVLGMGWFPDQPGGLNRYVRDLVVAMRGKGIRVHAAVTGPVTDPTFDGIEAARVDDAFLLRIYRYARNVARIGGEVDVVDAHFAPYALLPAYFGRLRRLPMVVHFQGPWAEESAAVGSRAWKLAIKRRVEWATYRRSQAMIVLSGAFKRILVERYGVAPWSVHVVPPGVDLETFRPGPVDQARRALGVPNGIWVALTVRRLVARMGVDMLLRAWAQLTDGEKERLLLIAGNGPARTELEALAGELGIASSVRFLGSVSEEDLLLCYQAADISVVPSVALEGFGLVVLESLACGTPVIASDSGGLPEALSGLDGSLVVPAGNVTALATRLRGALSGAVPGRSRCRQYAEHFSWEAAASRNLEIYQQARDAGTPRLRVLYLDHCASLSGGELALARLLPALVDVDPHVVLAEDGPLVPRLLAAGVSVEVLPMRDATRDLRRDRVQPGKLPLAAVIESVLYIGRLARRIRRLQPDIVHTNSLKSAVYGGLAARLAGVPVVWHIRDRIADDYLPGPAVRLVRALARRLPDAVIANSRSTLATLPNCDGRGRAVQTTVSIGDPVPLDHGNAHPKQDGFEGRLSVGMVGRLAPWKGQHVFLEAFSQAFPTGDAVLGHARATLVGSALFGESDYEQELLQLAVRLGIEDRVAWTGFMADVPSQLATFNILVHASVIPEPFGLVVVEGMAAGLPVVAARAGGPSEIIADGVNGLLFPPADVAALAQILVRLAREPGLRWSLGQAAKRKAAEFTPEAIGGQVMKVYRDVCGAGRRGGQRGIPARPVIDTPRSPTGLRARPVESSIAGKGNT